VKRLAWPLRIVAATFVLCIIALAVLWFVPSGDYILLPDKAQAVGPLITVKGQHKRIRDKGQIYFLAVLVRKARLLEDLFPGIRDGATLVPASELQSPGVSQEGQHAIDAREMVRSQDVAAAVALKSAGYPVNIRATGARIAAVDPSAPAADLLRETEVIVSVNGGAVHTPDQLHARMSQVHPGEKVRLGIRTPNGLKTVSVPTVPDKRDKSRALIGVLVDQAGSVHLPFRVRINPGAVVGPSAGLAFALEIMEKVGRDVDRGHKIAATGELELNGAVAPIGGVEQKTIEARNAGADVMLIPAGDNAAVARKYAGGMRVIPVDSFQQALHALATLPKKG
jgi:PDZ domain-containing protein